MAPKAIGPDDKIPCLTVDHLKLELEQLGDVLGPEETEDTWGKFERALLRFSAVTRGGGFKHLDVYVPGVGIQGLGDKIVRCMLSDRGKLSGVATDFLTSMAPRLASSFIPLINLYVPPLIKLLARPNKVYLRRAEKSLFTIAQYCSHPSLIMIIKSGIDDKSETCRRSCGAVLAFILESWETNLIGSRGMGEIEDAMKRMATERDAEVRKIAKGMWEVYNTHYHDRVDQFTAPMTPTTRKYLDIKPSAGSSLLLGSKKNPLSSSTTAVRYPSTLNANPGRSVSTSSTSAQIGATAGQRSASGSRPVQTGFPFPTSDITTKPVLSRSASSVTGFRAGPAAQPARSGSTLDVRGTRGLKSSTSNMTVASMVEPVAQSSMNRSQTTAGPSRPRVLSALSTPDVGAVNTGMTAAHARRAGMAAIGQGPVRPARLNSGLANVTEGKESVTTPRSNLFGAPIRPNLQARVTSATIPPTSSTGDALKAMKRVASTSGAPTRKPILPAGVQAKLDAKHRRIEEENDVFSAGPTNQQTEDKKDRQPFKPSTIASREAGEVDKRNNEPKTIDRNTPVVKASALSRMAKQSPQAKLVVTPRAPKVKLKAPLPFGAAAVARKKEAALAGGNAGSSGTVPTAKARANTGGQRTPFKPMSRSVASTNVTDDLGKTEQSRSHTTSPVPIARPKVIKQIDLKIAQEVPLPPSPKATTSVSELGELQQEQQGLIVDPFCVSVPGADALPNPVLIIPATLELGGDQAERGLLTSRPAESEPVVSKRVADLLPESLVQNENDEDVVFLLDEHCPSEVISPAASSVAETIPVVWDSDIQTEDEEDIDAGEDDSSVASVTFKKPQNISYPGSGSLARAIAKKLVVQKAEADKENSTRKSPTKPSSAGVLGEREPNLPATPVKLGSAVKKPEVKRLTQFFENLSPPETNAQNSPEKSSPSARYTGRNKVWPLSPGTTTPSNSPPLRMTT